MVLYRRAAAALIALLTVFSLFSLSAGTASAEGPEDVGQKLAVPAYFPPTGDGGALWDKLADPDVGIVVANPFNGPGQEFDSAYAAKIQAAKNAGATVLGYVPTGYLGTTGRATRLGETTPLAWLAQAQQDTRRWYEMYASYGLGGIFWDEVQNVCGTDNIYADTYKALDEAVKGHYKGAFTVINPGIATEECYDDIGDVSLTFEGTYASYQTWTPPAWHAGKDPQRFWHLVHATDTEAKMADAMSLGKQRNAGYMYVTPDVLANPWDSLPPTSYWNAELAAANTSTDTTAPTATTDVWDSNSHATSLNLAWQAATDTGSGVAAYEVYVDGKRVYSTPGSTPAATIRGLEPDTDYSIAIRTRDLAGNTSALSSAEVIDTEVSDTDAPNAPGNLHAAQTKVASVRLAWNTPETWEHVASYEVSMGGTPLMTIDADMLDLTPAEVVIPVSGLTPSTAYSFTVTARDTDGDVSATAGPLQVTTATPSGNPIEQGQGTVGTDTVTYQAQYNLPYDFHHVLIDVDNNAATGHATNGIGADYLIENTWVYQHAGSGWNWTPINTPSPLVSFVDDLYVWQLPKSALGGTVSSHRAVFHGAGSSAEAYSSIITVE